MIEPGQHQPAPRQTVVYGRPVSSVLTPALDAHNIQRVVLVTSSSLSAPGGLADTIKQALGDRLGGIITGIRAHSPRRQVADIANQLRSLDADAVIGLGGGSVGDAVKCARLCLANEVFSAEDMDSLRMGSEQKPPSLFSVMIPTTLSAAEFTNSAGITDERGPRKEGFVHDQLPPNLVILDPEMVLRTPSELWFGTGMRAVDHAIETWCSINATPYSDAVSQHALRLLVAGLRKSRDDRDDLQATLQCQVGAWLSIQGYASGVDLGGSHGIGHALGGTANMPHGETSCVMLPHILRFNHSVNPDRQAMIAEAMGRPGVPAADAVAELVALLEMPARLRDAGIAQDILPQVAQEAVRDPWVATNPRKIDGVKGVLDLLEGAW